MYHGVSLEWDSKNSRLLLRTEFAEFVATLIIPDTLPLRSLYAWLLPLLYAFDVAHPRHSRICDSPDFRIAHRTLYPRWHFA